MQAVIYKDVQFAYPDGERVLDALCRDLGQLLGVYRRDRVRQVLPLDAGRLSGHDDRFQLEVVAPQRHLHRALVGGHPQVFALEPDAAHHQRHFARRHGERERPVVFDRAADRSSCDRYLTRRDHLGRD